MYCKKWFVIISCKRVYSISTTNCFIDMMCEDHTQVAAAAAPAAPEQPSEQWQIN
jgi:hypothetical protein